MNFRTERTIFNIPAAIRTVENQSQVEGEAHLVGVVEVAAGHNIRVVGTSVMMRI